MYSNSDDFGVRDFRPLTEASENVADGIARRCVDLAFVALMTPILLPVFAIIALALKISEPREPVFFGVTRYGKHGRAFHMWKFRTMKNSFHLVRCEQVIRAFLPEVDFKLTNDPRISRIGAALRRSHLDELPQFFNVLRGDITLVGPRPNSLPPSQYKPWQLERLSVTPGVTGHWQIHGRRTRNYDERFAEEIEFIRNRTVVSEIKIVLETIWHCISSRGMV